MTAFAETYRIDTKGNVDQSTSALGFVTTITNDGIGFPTAVTSPINSAQTQQQTMTYSYNDLNRLTGSSSSGPGGTVSTTHVYDLEGNVTGTTTPHGTISWLYDLAGRQQTETIAGTTETRTFDVASRVTQIVDRRGLTIGMGYDALNRMTSRNYPAVPYATRSDGTWRHPTVTGFTVPAGSEAFGYNAGGQVTSANNADAQVARGYNASGMLTSEALSIRSVAGTFGQHLFTTMYGYDVAKRLISITVPSQFSNVTSQSQSHS